MERLTERFSNGQAAVLGCGNNCKYDFKYCQNPYEDCPTINEMYEKLAQYEDLEEQGKLPKLPCSVGDTIYAVSRGRVFSLIVSKIEIFPLEGKETIQIVCTDDVSYGYMHFLTRDFGRTIFLVKEQAEAELKKNGG